MHGVFGLGSCVFLNKLYYFFGGLGFDRKLQVRVCSSQVIEFDPESRSYTPIQLWHKPERLLTERRYVSTLLVGEKLLCLGGINKHGYGLSDLICINMITKQWYEMKVLNHEEEGPGCLYSAAMCLVAYKERDLLAIDLLSEIKWNLVSQEIAQEGIYVFGGIKGMNPNTSI